MSAAFALPAMAQGYVVSGNGLVAIGANSTGNLDANVAGIGGPSPSNGSGLLGIAYNAVPGRTGWQDALSPGCACEAWGVAGNGQGNQVGATTGNQGISLVSQAGVPGTSFTSVTSAAGSGLTVTHSFSVATETATGALFKAEVTVANNTGATVADVRYARAMDWDVPPTEFREYVTHKGVPTTASLLHATDDGFANANPMTATSNGGIATLPNTEGDQGGVADHGSLFVFGFGSLLDGATKTFNIFYGAGANLADALALLGAVGPELYSLGQSNSGGVRNDGAPTFVFAFNGVGGTVVVPPTGVPGPAGLGILGFGLLGLMAARRRRA
ncbi:hypothetical protein ACI6QG_19395 [Roseococcus sp. DSY-14]|uniref:hypothetical protein n=1 Tax=Roseococcus sp. DSY-14 TaxID=3369650 RepID=UPI00387B5121